MLLAFLPRPRFCCRCRCRRSRGCSTVEEPTVEKRNGPRWLAEPRLTPFGAPAAMTQILGNFSACFVFGWLARGSASTSASEQPAAAAAAAAVDNDDVDEEHS